MSSSALDEQPAVEAGGRHSAKESATAVIRALRIDTLSGLWVLAIVAIVFSIWVPDSFPTMSTLRSILNQNAITAIVALSLLVPLSAGLFDLSIGNAMALASVVTASLIVFHGYTTITAIIAVLVISVAVGVFNGFFIVKLGIASFIGTLGTGAVLQAIVVLISGDTTVTSAELNSSFGKLAITEIGGLQVTVYVALVLAAVLWWLLEHTVTGRRLYATGFNEEAARLAGVRTRRLRFLAMIVSPVVAGLAGILATAQVGSGSPDIGPTYLLDAFAVAFLGATQLKRGRFNSVGTIIGVLLLGTGTSGLSQVGAPTWAISLFTGVVLLAALALTRLEIVANES
jgi:ribose transport system permease protein